MNSFVGLILLGITNTAVFSQSPPDTSASAILNQAYPLIEQNPTEAIKLFERALIIEPENILARRQLGYLYMREGKNELALQQFTAAEKIRQSDTTKLQIAFLLNTMEHKDEAKLIFQELQYSSDPEIQAQAIKSVSLFSVETESPPKVTQVVTSHPHWRFHFYATPYYDSRFKTSFYQSHFSQGYYFTSENTYSIYSIVSVSGDAKSSGGIAPIIFSDNALILGLGLRAKPLTGLTLNIQEGIAIDLIKRGTIPRTQGDFRFVGDYSYGLYAPRNVHSQIQFPFSIFGDFTTSAGYYSRYKNLIGYSSMRAGVRLVEVSVTALDIYGFGRVVRDWEKEFYNNLIEGGFGVRLIPNINWGLHIVGDFQRGRYWQVSPKPIPYELYYNSFRLFLIIDHTF
ncbi:MAG TPA: tetratricopeptide repeat protein [Bacteroidota bacterium]|nr:tetratricopeptide repeat protein [Bacteroidota bacterium]